MEPFYSSDEEIAWGPPTLREIKSDLKKCGGQKSNRRHTTVCSIQNHKMDESLPDEVNRINISAASTAYYTPNESLKTNNSNFLDKLSHVINIPSSEFSEYASALEDTDKDNSNKPPEGTFSQERPVHIPTIHVTEHFEHSHNDSCTNFIKALENRKTHYDLENFQQTLVENTYFLPEEEKITSDKDNMVHENNTDKESVYKDEIIVISDNSFSTNSDAEDLEYIGKTDISFKDFKVCKREYIDNVEIEYDCSPNENSFESSEPTETMKLEDKTELVTGNISDDVSTSCEENEQPKNEDSFLTPGMQRKLPVIEEALSTSPIIVPEIDLTQFDDSISKDESLQLNDTLEEINRLLCQGLNYSMSDDEVIESTPAKKEPTPKRILTSSNQNFSTKQQLSSDSKETLSHIPKRIFDPPSAEKRQVRKQSPKANFKVPVTPSRSKLTHPTPPKSCPNHLKNIVSPVALYIKNSPRIPLKKNIPQRELHKIVTSNIRTENKENFPEFPEVLYKPSKKTIVSTEKHIIIPPYLRKLNITEGQITKHEGRFHNELDRTKISKQLLQTDITNNSIDHSLLNNTGDVSVLTNKQAFIK